MITKAIENITGWLRALWPAYLRRHYTALFYVLLLTIVAVPLATALGTRGALIEFLLATSLLAAVLPLRSVRNRRHLLTFAVLLWLAHPVTVWLHRPVLSAIILGMWTVIGLLAMARALRFAMSATRVDAEHLYAALSAYLLEGIFFGLLYWGLEQIGHGSFATDQDFTPMSALYFSFVTLATLGYGDIVPRTDIARGLAIVEGVGGQLFLTVMVARLVSLYARGQETE
ncbi:MAG: potassium channel family protein [Chloroflexota bacterium]